jgi:hypothetical protein
MSNEVLKRLGKSQKQAETLSKLYQDRATILEGVQAKIEQELKNCDEKVENIDNKINELFGATTTPEKKSTKSKSASASRKKTPKKKSRGRGRPKGSTNASRKKAPKKASSRTRGKGSKLTMSVIVSDLIQNSDGIDLKGLVKGCIDAGYKSKSSPKGFEQNVRSNLNTLANKGLVVKNEENKTYHWAEEKAKAA